MARSVLDIIINFVKQQGAEKETVKSLANIKKNLMNAAAAGGMLVGAGIAIKKALDETVGAVVAYADQVRNVQLATGASAEDSSRLIQILDDQKISYEQLEKAIAKSGKTFDFSIQGIANMSDEYNRLGTTQEKAAFMQERFGKQWQSFIPVMKQGSQGILEMAAAVDKSQILTQKAVDDARKYEIALDAWNDSIMGVKWSLGQQLLPTVTQTMDGFNVYIRAIQIAREEGLNFSDATDKAGYEIWLAREALMAQNEALEENAEAAEASAEQIKAVSAANKDMLGLITKVASETQSYSEKQADLTQKMAANRAEADQLYPHQAEQLAELNASYVEMQEQYNANAEAHRVAMGRIQYDLLITKLSADGLTEAEFEIAQQAGLTFGVFDQESIEAARNMNLVAEAVADGRLKVEDMGRVLEMLPSHKNIDVVLNAIASIPGALPGSNPQAQPGGYGYQGAGYAAGGISTGPQSGHWELLHGTEAVIPLQNGAVPVQMSGGQGGGNVTIHLNVSSPVTVMDQQNAQNVLLPYIVEGVRKARAGGALK